MKKAVTKALPRKLVDQPARDRIRNDLDTTLVVEAAAGTGKTSELIRRLLSGICSGRLKLASTVAVTFTEFAAGELKLRLRSAIEKARQDPDCSGEATEYLLEALRELEEARVGTIHSFCADLLREHPVEAGIDPLFEVAPDDRAQPLFNLAFDRWFEDQLAAPGEGVRRILRRPPQKEFQGGRSATLARRPRDEGPRRILRSAAWALVRERDFTAPWQRAAEFAREAEIDALITEMKELGDWSDAGNPDQYLTKSLSYLKHYVGELTRTEEVTSRDYDGIEARLFSFLPGWRSKNLVAYFTKDTFPKAELVARRDALKESVTGFLQRAGADLAPRLREELWPVVDAYEQLKERAGYLDFFDLLLRSRNLIREGQDIRAELQQRFTHIFVDEFQDTDPLQAEILMLLAAEDSAEDDWRRVRPVPGKLFIVGDPKQSIYRFRRADVALYQEVKRQIVAVGGAVVELNVSFRMVPEIQDAINAAFAPVMGDESSTQAHYVPLAPYRPGVETQPAIVALPVPKPFSDYGKVVNWKIDESLPETVGAFVDWLVNQSGWTVTEREHPDVRVPIQARHVCLLFRRFRHYFADVTRPYVRALEDRQVPHLLVGGSSFHSREEVEALRNALTAIEWPDDELAVFATLRGPLFAFTDSELLAYRTRCSALHPFRKVPDDLPEALAEVVDGLSTLRELHRQRNRRSIAETIGNLLATTRAHAGFANWPTGEQALANLMRLTDMARRAEQNGLISFRGFVDWLGDQAENGEAGDAPIMEEGVDGVRMMTVHKAKGLEFPVVLLADITCKDGREPSRWASPATKLCAMTLAGCVPIELQEHAAEEMQIDKEEAARTLYVAATRARDLLVVCAIGDQPFEGWLATLNPVIYPLESNSFNPETDQPPGCPKFGGDNAIARPRKALRPEGSVTPGLHKPQAGKHHVVWWDPALLELDKHSGGGSTLTELLKVDEPGVRSGEGIRAHEEWQKQRATVRQVAGKLEWTVVTATTYAATLTDGSKSEKIGLAVAETLLDRAGMPTSLPEVTVESIEIDFNRPHGKRFGTLVHAVLSVAGLDSSRAEVEEVARVQGRILGATDEEVTAATETVSKALVHPLMRQAAAAASKGRCRREVPVAIKLQEGTIVEGIVDLAFQQEDKDNTWMVVDYKTDFEIKGRLEEYRTQVGLYAFAISRATGQAVRAALLRL
jgi:ATP-dependent helicase/nuclease subunit A